MAEGVVHSEGVLQTEDGRSFSRLVVPRDLIVQGGVLDTGIAAAPTNGWGRQWSVALRQASQRLVRIVMFGDSIALGQYTSDWLTLGVMGLLKTRLQARFGDGGSGFVAAQYKEGIGNGGGQVTMTGAWTDIDTDFGFGSRMAQQNTTPSSSATMTFPVRGTTVKMFFKTDPSFGTFHWQIDGGSFNAVNLNPAASVLVVTQGGLAAGNHTVTIRATTGTGRFYGVGGYNATGVVIDNCCWGGELLAQLASDVSGTSATDPYEDTNAWSTLKALGSVDLVMVMLGANDILLDVTDTTFQSDMWNALNALFYAASSWGLSAATPPEMMVIAQNIGKFDVLVGFTQYERDWLQLHSILRHAAEAMGALFVDLWALGRRNWNYWNGLGYWAAGPDDVHPGTTGHAHIADQLMPYLTRDPD